MFYDKGLNFECQRCHYCCSSEPGYVFLSERDISRASSSVGVSEDEFIRIYCRRVDYGLYEMVSLKEKDNYDCIFLTPKGCSIYEGRPEQCRTYPFWKGIMDDEKSWKKEGKSCPGIGKGRKIGREEILEMLGRNDSNPPFMIFKKK